MYGSTYLGAKGAVALSFLDPGLPWTPVFWGTKGWTHLVKESGFAYLYSIIQPILHV